MKFRLLVALAAFASSLMAAASASAMAPYIVVEVESGRVLMAEDATVPWYPASVTKLMTVYVTLREIKAGKIGLETPIPVSRRAAMAPPSKIGVKPGQEVTLDNAMKMLLVKSANDMAVVIAEGVGGTVEDFADMMNAEAARIGMAQSHFINPNGLWVEGQQTSARDMALLSRQILTEFPDYAGYFQIGALQLGKRVLKNTNGLIGRYPGIEGMKTGFICASGFNLVAVARRNERRLIAVVFGAPSNAERTLRAAEMLDKGFSSWGGGLGSLESMPASAIASPPNMREDICVHRKGVALSEEEAEPAVVSTKEDDGQLVRPGAILPMMSANGVRMPGSRSLAPRAEFDPIPVAIGRSAGSAMAPVAANAVAGRNTATAYAGDKKPLDGEAEAEEPTPGLKLKPQANQLPLSAAAAATIGKGQSKTGTGLGAIPAKPASRTAVVEPAARPAPTVAKAAASPKPKPVAKQKAKAKPVAQVAPGKHKTQAKPAAKAKVPAKPKAGAGADPG